MLATREQAAPAAGASSVLWLVRHAERVDEHSLGREYTADDGPRWFDPELSVRRGDAMARLTGVKLASLLRLEQQAQPSTPLNFDGVVHASPMVRTMQTAAALVPALQSVGSDGSLLAEAAGVRRVFGLGECTFACRKKLGGLGQMVKAGLILSEEETLATCGVESLFGTDGNQVEDFLETCIRLCSSSEGGGAGKHLVAVTHREGIWQLAAERAGVDLAEAVGAAPYCVIAKFNVSAGCGAVTLDFVSGCRAWSKGCDFDQGSEQEWDTLFEASIYSTHLRTAGI